MSQIVRRFGGRSIPNNSNSNNNNPDLILPEEPPTTKEPALVRLENILDRIPQLDDLLNKFQTFFSKVDEKERLWVDKRACCRCSCLSTHVESPNDLSEIQSSIQTIQTSHLNSIELFTGLSQTVENTRLALHQLQTNITDPTLEILRRGIFTSRFPGTIGAFLDQIGNNNESTSSDRKASYSYILHTMSRIRSNTDDFQDLVQCQSKKFYALCIPPNEWISSTASIKCPILYKIISKSKVEVGVGYDEIVQEQEYGSLLKQLDVSRYIRAHIQIIENVQELCNMSGLQLRNVMPHFSSLGYPPSAVLRPLIEFANGALFGIEMDPLQGCLDSVGIC